MDFPDLKTLARRPPVILAGLVVIAILAFLAVNHLVSRYREQQKALARHMFRRAESEVAAGRNEQAVESFRAALAYDRTNDLYQLNLARALRDTGRGDEARTYLIALWERAPEDSTVNLALARLAARQDSVQDALRYYHNATYGVWPTDADRKRRDSQFELVEFLLRNSAVTQAQAELITMSPGLPTDPAYHLRLGKLFARAQDHEHALTQFEQVLRLDHDNSSALSAAGRSAFELGEYRSAQKYLSQAIKRNPDDAEGRERLQQTDLILQADPYLRRISSAERERRVRAAFDQSGKRLDECLASKESPELLALKSRWTQIKPERARGRELGGNETAMDLVFQIEQVTAAHCGPPSGLDSALLVLSKDKDGVER